MGKVVCIFAHPDDEAFGPSGTIAKLSKDNEVYLICASRGGGQKSNYSSLMRIRFLELKKSAKILGIRSVTFLGFEDGEICNNKYHLLAGKIEKQINKIRPDTLLTFEPRGVSGHIDHIAVSMVTAYVFEKLKFLKKLYYFCLSSEQRNRIKDYFIYFPPGYSKSEIAEVIDVKAFLEQKLSAMKSHKSQKDDFERIIKEMDGLLTKEHFLVVEK